MQPPRPPDHDEVLVGSNIFAALVATSLHSSTKVAEALLPSVLCRVAKDLPSAIVANQSDFVIQECSLVVNKRKCRTKQAARNRQHLELSRLKTHLSSSLPTMGCIQDVLLNVAVSRSISSYGFACTLSLPALPAQHQSTERRQAVPCPL